ncbi:MAG: antitoxin family protein [Candidatus Aenigmatarchaeota archaeon]
MSKIIEAIYENGVFKPLEKVDLKEGERVRITISKKKKSSRGLSKLLEKYIIKSDVDITKMLIDERR